MQMEKEMIDNMVIDQSLPDEAETTRFLLRYQQFIMLYESAIQFISMRLELIGKERTMGGMRSPIRSVSSRIKNPHSITKKLKKRNVPLSIVSIQENLNDIAGVRVICEYITDIYAVKEALLSDGQIKLIREKDYIKNPKPNGYRSLHLLVSVPIPMPYETQSVKCEIQLRTTAMDCWAGLEHNLRYKKERNIDKKINSELKNCSEKLFETDIQMQKIAKQIGVLGEISDGQTR